MLGTFAPEIVLWRAITQWRVAREVRNKRNQLMTEAINKSTKSSSGSTSANASRVYRPWELEHGFLVVMGGMGITIAEGQDQEMLNNGSTITPFGALTLAKVGVLPDFEKERIAGRCKADSLGKMLVCIQALWMVLQTITRKVGGLPITLLELNTLAHVTCAVLMYFIWWKKPQNVDELFKVPVQKELAFFMSPKPAEPWEPWEPESWWRERSLDDPKYQPNGLSARTTNGFQVVGQVNEEWNSLPLQRKKAVETAIRKPDGVLMLYPGQSLYDVAWYLRDVNPIHLTQLDITKLFVESKKKNNYDIPQLDYNLQGMGLAREASNMRITGWEEFSIETLALFSFLSVMYGGIHGSSWNAHFPSVVEQMMWRAAVCSVAVGGFVISALLFMVSLLDNLTKSPRENLKSWITRGIQWGWGSLRIEDFGVFFFVVLLGMVVGVILLISLLIIVIVTLSCITLAYLFSRAFLVVESFISIRSLPAGAYNTVSWVGYWPHIG
jgi:hypothetical protein